jgi:hypothetical protein
VAYRCTNFANAIPYNEAKPIVVAKIPIRSGLRLIITAFVAAIIGNNEEIAHRAP